MSFTWKNYRFNDSVWWANLQIDADTGAIRIKETTVAPADVAAYWQIWVKNTTPNQLWFTRDDWTEVQIS